jgi:hypothetical protein
MRVASIGPSNFPHSIRAVSLATDRYKIVRTLGEGGMATVYEALDSSTGRSVAQKRLRTVNDPTRQRRMLELFEREFHTLSQIAHPCVVEAYDYGVDELGAFYTMELLDGSELQKLAPLPWQQVCRVGRDLCSALSLLHSRRLVYRDLNPRNVHCTLSGAAKLVDFGAVISPGPSRQVVGTPAYCAPETINLQPLDARTDLYSLGATLYFALTGVHAYPAKSFAQLNDCWQEPPGRPAAFVPEIPAALDALIMDLLQLDPQSRPANASEVAEQLAVLEGHPLDQHVQVTQAYLSTPTLVGRDAVLARARGKLQRMLRGHGSALLFTGASGVGRTRLLAACLLEAKLLGSMVLHADASDARADYGAVQALASALLEQNPELAKRTAQPRLALLGHAIPELLAGQPELALQSFDDPVRARAAVLAALREWFLAVAGERPLLIAIDDLHKLDEPSAACLALCVHEASKCALIVVATAENDVSVVAPGPFKLIEAAATSTPVTNLSAPQTEALLRSVFGDVPHVQAVAHKLHGISAGNPRDSLQLAQNLVDQGIAHYRAGTWSLPASFDDGNLPANMAQALLAQVQGLSPRAREYARLMSVALDRPLKFEEFVTLTEGASSRQVNDSLEELLLAQVAKRSGESYSVAHRGFHAALQHELDDAAYQRIHRALAELFARRGDEEFLRAMHLLRARAWPQALDTLIAHAIQSQALTDRQPDEFRKLVDSLPQNWLDVYVRSIALCSELGRPSSDAFALRSRLASLLNVMGCSSEVSRPQLLSLLAQLKSDSGLDDYAALGSEPDAAQRLQRALQLATTRYEQSPEAARCLPPTAAIKLLVRAQIIAAGVAAFGLDGQLWAALPSLRPLFQLSPALAVADQLARGVGARITGRYEQACEIYQQILERAALPDRAGLEAGTHRFVMCGVHCAKGVMEAGMGVASSLQCADAIEHEPLYQVQALQIRMIYQLWQGRIREADKFKERIELLRIENMARQITDGMHIVGQVTAHANSDDLTRLKQVLDEIQPYAQRHPQWMPVLYYASGEYQRVRGDHATAALQLEMALSATRAGTHQIWPHAAAAYGRVLLLLGREREAADLGAGHLLAADAAQLGYLHNYIKLPLALASAALGKVNRAAELADSVIDSFERMQSGGLNLVLAYETRARVAIHAKSSAAYQHFANLCEERCRASDSRVLHAKLDRLVRAATAADVRATQSDATAQLTMLTGTQLTSILAGYNKPAERALRTLELLLRRSGSNAGYLFLMHEHGAEIAAQVGVGAAPPSLAAAVAELVDSELADCGLRTCSLEADSAADSRTTWRAEDGRVHRLVLLSHQTPDGFAVTGVAVLALAAEQVFVHPGTLAAHLSRLISDAGDVAALLGE